MDRGRVDLYIRVWEYQVTGQHVEAFLAAYGSDGEWVNLFSGSGGYAGTDLYRSTAEADRFLTVDRWDVEGSWRAFLDAHREAYDALDARLAGLTLADRPLIEGSF